MHFDSGTALITFLCFLYQSTSLFISKNIFQTKWLTHSVTGHRLAPGESWMTQRRLPGLGWSATQLVLVKIEVQNLLKSQPRVTQRRPLSLQLVELFSKYGLACQPTPTQIYVFHIASIYWGLSFHSSLPLQKSVFVLSLSVNTWHCHICLSYGTSAPTSSTVAYSLVFECSRFPKLLRFTWNFFLSVILCINDGGNRNIDENDDLPVLGNQYWYSDH